MWPMPWAPPGLSRRSWAPGWAAVVRSAAAALQSRKGALVPSIGVHHIEECGRFARESVASLPVDRSWCAEVTEPAPG